MPAAALRAAAEPTPAKERERPKTWSKWVRAAYFRICERTQKEAATAAGISVRTLRYYEADIELWQMAKREARLLMESDLIDIALRAVRLSTERGNADLGLKLLERLDPRFAPPVQRVAGKVDGEMTHRYVVELPLESEGKDSLPAAEVIGRDLNQLMPPQQPEVAHVDAAPLRSETRTRAAKRPVGAMALLATLQARKPKSVSRSTLPAPIELPDETEGEE